MLSGDSTILSHAIFWWYLKLQRYGQSHGARSNAGSFSLALHGGYLPSALRGANPRGSPRAPEDNRPLQPHRVALAISMGVSSFGNYADVPAKLQVISVAVGTVADLDYTSVSAVAKGPGDILYILCGGYDENWNLLPGSVYKHDMKANRPLGAFVTDGTVLPDAYSISATSDGFVYVGCSDYKNTGDAYVFTSEGTLHDKFDVQGLNPLKAYRY